VPVGWTALRAIFVRVLLATVTMGAVFSGVGNPGQERSAVSKTVGQQEKDGFHGGGLRTAQHSPSLSRAKVEAWAASMHATILCAAPQKCEGKNTQPCRVCDSLIRRNKRRWLPAGGRAWLPMTSGRIRSTCWWLRRTVKAACCCSNRRRRWCVWARTHCAMASSRSQPSRGGWRPCVGCAAWLISIGPRARWRSPPAPSARRATAPTS